MADKRFFYINFILLTLNDVISHVCISDLCFTLTCYTPLAICQASRSSTAGVLLDNAQAAWHVCNQYSGYWRPPACVAQPITLIIYDQLMCVSFLLHLSLPLTNCPERPSRLIAIVIEVHARSSLHVSPFTTKSVCFKVKLCHLLPPKATNCIYWATIK